MYTKTQYFARFLTVAFIFISFLSVFSFVQAQENSQNSSTVSISNVNSGSFKDGQYVISFQVANQGQLIPNLKYGVVLTSKTPQGELVVDEMAEAETTTLSQGERKAVNFVYTPSSVLDGTYSLSVEVRNDEGFVLAKDYVGDINLTRTANSGVYIDPTSCYLTVGDSPDEYLLGQTPTLNLGEVLTSHCLVKNIGNEELELISLNETYRRSVFGLTGEVSQVSNETFNLAAGESREISTILPVAKNPQIYKTKLSYGYAPSNAVYYEYKISGSYASVESLTLDADRFSAGDALNLSVKLNTSEDIVSPSAFISLENQNGDSCSMSQQYFLMAAEVNKIMVPVTVDCINPVLSLILSDSTEGILGEYSYSITSMPTNEVSMPTKTQSSGMPIWLVVLFGTAFLIVTILAFVFLRKNGSTPEASISGPLALLLVASALTMSSSYSLSNFSNGATLAAQALPAYCNFMPFLPQCDAPDITGVNPNLNDPNFGDPTIPPGSGSNPVTPPDPVNPPASNGVYSLTLNSSPQICSANGTGDANVSWTMPEGQSVLFRNNINNDEVMTSGDGSADIPATLEAVTLEMYSCTGSTPSSCNTLVGSVILQGTSEGCSVSLPGSGGSPSISAVPCIIPLHGSTCSIPGQNGEGLFVSGVDNLPGAAVYVRENEADTTPTLYSTAFGTLSANWVRPHLIFDLYSNNINSGGQLLASVGGVAECAPNTRWNQDSLSCVSAPPTGGGAPVQFCNEGDSNCPSINASGPNVIPRQYGDGVSVLFNSTLSLRVSGLSPGAKMCQVFRIHPNGSYVPTPLSYAQQYCTYESNYTDISVSNGVANLDIPQVNPDYAINAVYDVCFKNSAPGSKAVCERVSVDPFGGIDTPNLRPGSCGSFGSPAVNLHYSNTGAGVFNIGESIGINMSVYPELEPVQFSLEVIDSAPNVPGNSVSLDRTSGTFFPGQPGSDNGIIAYMTAQGHPRTVYVKVTAYTSGPNTGSCGTSPFTNGVSFNLHYPGVGQSYQCVGTFPANGQTHGGAYTTNVPNKPWTYKPAPNTGSLRSCEFRCLDGYKWSNPGGEGDLWSEGSCVPDNITARWKIVPATGSANMCNAWQEGQKQFAQDGHPCNSDQADRFYHACDSIDGNQYSCVLPDGAEAPQNTWRVDRDDFYRGPTCPGNFNEGMRGQVCSQPGYACGLTQGGQTNVYSCGSSIPSVGVGRVLDYQTLAPVSGVKLYKGYSGAVLVGFDDGQCVTSDASGNFRIGVRNMAGGIDQVGVLSGTPVAQPESQRNCYNQDYVYWDGGTIYHDQGQLIGGERIVPVEDILVRRISGTAQKADLVSTALEVPATAFSGRPFVVTASSKNDGEGSTGSGYKTTFSYRVGENGVWNELATFDNSALPAKSSSDARDSYTLSVDTQGAVQSIYIKHCVNTGSTKVDEENEANNCSERGPITISPDTGMVWTKEDVSGSGPFPARCETALDKQPRLGAACTTNSISPCLAGDFIYKCEPSS